MVTYNLFNQEQTGKIFPLREYG